MSITKKAFFLLPVLFLTAFAASGQRAVELKQAPLSRWNIGTANYSGITALGGDRYALVSDKEPADGFFLFHIVQDSLSGEVLDVRMEGFRGNPSPELDAQGMSVRDCEGVAWFPPASTVFVSGEGDQQILEYRLDGTRTGRALQVPPVFARDRIVPNYGFEALTYSPETHRFWTTTETMLPADGQAAGPLCPGAQNLLRIQAFDDSLLPVAQYAYRMDRGKADDFGLMYVYGVPALAALPDGRLLVLEREADVSNGYLSSQVVCKIFEVLPRESWQIDSHTRLSALDPNRFMVKRLLAAFTTRFTPFSRSFANYEGMCLGRRLADGRQTLLLVSDSQGGYGRGPFHLKDYIKVLVLSDAER